MALDTNTDVTEIDTVVDDAGDLRSPSNLTLQKEIRNLLQDLTPATSTLSGFSYSTGGTTAEQLPANTVPASAEVLLQANPNNTGRVYVGDSTAQPIGLSPDGSMTLDVTDTAAIYVQTPNAGDSVGVLYEDA